MPKSKRKVKTKMRIKNRSLYKRRTRKKNKRKNSRNKYGGVVGQACNINEQPDLAGRTDNNRYLSNNCNSASEYCNKHYECEHRWVPWRFNQQRWGTGPHPFDAPTNGAEHAKSNDWPKETRRLAGLVE